MTWIYPVNLNNVFLIWWFVDRTWKKVPFCVLCFHVVLHAHPRCTCARTHVVLFPWKQGLLIWLPAASQWLHQCLTHRAHDYSSVIAGRMNKMLRSTLPSLLLIKSKSRRRELEKTTPRGTTGLPLLCMATIPNISGSSLRLSPVSCPEPESQIANCIPHTLDTTSYMARGHWNSIQPASPPMCPLHSPSQKTACHPWPSPLPGTPVPSSQSHHSSDIRLSILETPCNHLSDPSIPCPLPPIISSPWTEWPSWKATLTISLSLLPHMNWNPSLLGQVHKVAWAVVQPKL